MSQNTPHVRRNGPRAASTGGAARALRGAALAGALLGALALASCCHCGGRIDPGACPDRLVRVQVPVWTPPTGSPIPPPRPALASAALPQPATPEDRRAFVRALLLDLTAWVGYGTELERQLGALRAAVSAAPDPSLQTPP